MPYFIVRPKVVRAIQWTGSNFTEVTEFVDVNSRPLADAGDGVLMTGGGYYPEMPVPTGGWVDETGTPFDFGYHQEVSGFGISYAVEE